MWTAVFSDKIFRKPSNERGSERPIFDTCNTIGEVLICRKDSFAEMVKVSGMEG